MLCEFMPFKMLPFLIIIFLTLAQNGLMVSRQQSFSHNSRNLVSSTQLISFEIVVPDHLEALGSRLTVQIRRSPQAFSQNATMSGGGELLENEIKPREMYLQLGMYDTDGKAVMLTQEKITEPISANWQQVSFDCGWIVKGGKYFVYLLYYPNELGDEDDGDSQSSEYSSRNLKEFSREPYKANSRASSILSFPSAPNVEARETFSNQFTFDRVNNQTSSFHNKSNVNDRSKLENMRPSDIGKNRLRVLAKKTLYVKFPTILFEVPTRLETYTTSAPVTFGLTKTICKPKIRLPSTVLTLTMCSFAPGEPSGPSLDHFSSNHVVTPNVEGTENSRRPSHTKPTNKPPPSFKLSNEAGAMGSSANQPHHHYHDRHHRRYNPDHHSSYSSTHTSPHSHIPRAMNKRQNTSFEDDGYGSDPQTEIKNKLECHRDVATVFQDPLIALQTEGRVTINVDCQLWGRNATYVIQLRETNSHTIIAQSSFIKVEWSSQFSLELSKSSILRCQGSIRATVSHPQCILPGRDKIRVYGHETLPVPSLLAPKRISYIGEQQIKVDNKLLNFRCNMFPARFLRFCFQYVNTAVDDSVAVVVEKCIPTGPANKIADGGWSSWSNWSSCSVTCGTSGKRFRYRFCDSPPPTSGANFCQGKAIQEEPCDAGIPCPQIPLRAPPTNEVKTGLNEQSTISPGEIDHYNRDEWNRMRYGGSGRPSFMDISVLNVSTTPGCECGCILYDLVPTKNYSLVIIVTSNQSSCADEDEEDHHNFRWILHAKNDEDRIRLDIVGMDVQCVVMTFRDGNTTDSNLLEVITASQPSDPIQFEGIYQKQMGQRSTPTYSQASYLYDDEDDMEDTSEENEHMEDDSLYETGENEVESEDIDDGMNQKGSTSILRIESSGSSLSIGTTSEANKNCSGQFIYFIAYYSTISSHAAAAGVTETKNEIVGYNFWTFFLIKVMVLCFVTVVVCSTFGGCVTKVYRKYKYKELRCFENDDEEGSLNEEGNEVRKSRRGTLDDTSRCTSITLTSFDYSYWRRLRILRLKYFLLRPRPLDPVTTKIKSFPNTPTASKKIKEYASTSAGRNNNPKTTLTNNVAASGDEPISKMQTCSSSNDRHNPSLLNKPISLSETNLQEKSAVLAVTKSGYELRRARNKNRKITTKKNDVDCKEERSSSTVNGVGLSGGYPKHGTNSLEHGSVSDMYGGDGNVSLTSTSVSISMSQSLNGSETASSISITTPTPALHGKKSNKKDDSKLRSGGIKLLKEQENLKRKASKKKEGESEKEETHYRPGTSSLTPPPRSLSSSESSHRGILKKRIIRANGGEAGGKGSAKRILKHGDSSASVSTIQSAGMSSTCDEDSSRVGSRAYVEDTDQDFEMDYYDYDVMNAGNIPGSYLGLEPAFVLWNSEVYHNSDEESEVDADKEECEDKAATIKAVRASQKGVMEDSACSIEMTPSSSIGMLSSDLSQRNESGVEETSLDTLKFADEDDDEYGSYGEIDDDSSHHVKSMKDSGYSSHRAITKDAANTLYRTEKL